VEIHSIPCVEKSESVQIDLRFDSIDPVIDPVPRRSEVAGRVVHVGTSFKGGAVAPSAGGVTHLQEALQPSVTDRTHTSGSGSGSGMMFYTPWAAKYSHWMWHFGHSVLSK
jgi:hypothetical protein